MEIIDADNAVEVAPQGGVAQHRLDRLGWAIGKREQPMSLRLQRHQRRRGIGERWRQPAIGGKQFGAPIGWQVVPERQATVIERLRGADGEIDIVLHQPAPK